MPFRPCVPSLGRIKPTVRSLSRSLGSSCHIGATERRPEGALGGLLCLSPAHWRAWWRAPALGRHKPCVLQGSLEYRHGDSNPGFRRERAAS